jgi:hypothetical protein
MVFREVYQINILVLKRLGYILENLWEGGVVCGLDSSGSRYEPVVGPPGQSNKSLCPKVYWELRNSCYQKRESFPLS